MIVHLRRSLVSIVIFTVIFGFIYAFAGTGVAQVLFKYQANGSINSYGSTLIGQDWSQTKCGTSPLGSCVFQGRPDDLGPYADANGATTSPVGHGGDNPLVANGVTGGSGATNLGPRSAELLEYTKELVAYWHARGVDPTPDLVTTSGSGLDPDISEQDAIVQIPMVSKATGMSDSVLRTLIAKETMPAELGFMGTSYIDVLELNVALVKLGEVTTTAIAAVVPRTPARIEGEVVSMTSHATPPTFLDVAVSDGTGTITLLFQGRTGIPGITEGTRLRVSGTPWQMSELLVMLNPCYELRD